MAEPATNRKPLASIIDAASSSPSAPATAPAAEGEAVEALDPGELAATEEMGMTPEQGLALRDFFRICMRKYGNTTE